MNVTPELPVLIIDAGEQPPGKQLRDLWAYRELLYFLAWRDFKVRYKQTALGAAWDVDPHRLAPVGIYPHWGTGLTGGPFMDAMHSRVLTETGTVGLVAFFILIGAVFRMG